MAESRRSPKEFQIRTVVNAVLGESIWNLSYNERRMALELEITKCLEEEEVDMIINQFPVPADYDLQEIRLLDTGRNVTGWPSDALKYNPESV